VANEPFSSVFGPLECRTLEALWRRSEPASVRDLWQELPDVAYTTLMTTLDRLYKKDVLARQRRGRAFYYVPRFDRERLRSHLATDAFAALLGGTGNVRPLLSCFIDAVSKSDELMLDELERLVQERRRRGKR
jgi:predicted transcriptional regulator